MLSSPQFKESSSWQTLIKTSITKPRELLGKSIVRCNECSVLDKKAFGYYTAAEFSTFIEYRVDVVFEHFLER